MVSNNMFVSVTDTLFQSKSKQKHVKLNQNFQLIIITFRDRWSRWSPFFLTLKVIPQPPTLHSAPWRPPSPPIQSYPGHPWHFTHHCYTYQVGGRTSPKLALSCHNLLQGISLIFIGCLK